MGNAVVAEIVPSAMGCMWTSTRIHGDAFCVRKMCAGFVTQKDGLETSFVWFVKDLDVKKYKNIKRQGRLK